MHEEKLQNLSAIYARRGQFLPEELEQQARNHPAVHDFLLSRPQVKVGDYSDGFEDWSGTSFSYEKEFGTIYISIDGYLISIFRGEGGVDNFKNTSNEPKDKVEGAFTITVEDEDYYMRDFTGGDEKQYLVVNFPRKEG